MILRNVTKNLERALARQAAVAVLGPRQVGKTTLALEVGETKNALYLDLENPSDRNKLNNPVLFLETMADRLVILDEIHRLPEIFNILRGIIDQGRRNNQGKGRFLILGSAAIELLQQSETLAGRITYIELTPIQILEIEKSRQVREQLWLRGGFPDAFLADNDDDSLALRQDFIRTYLERDVAIFGPRVPATTMERLWTMLAHNHGTLLNASQLARNLGLSTQSVTRYIDLLCDLLLVRRLPPLKSNISKRLVRSPKVYIRDSGLLHALLGLADLNQVAGHPIIGQSWEGFVIDNLLSTCSGKAYASFYRTAVGAEIDLVLEFKNGRRIGIEIKRSLNAKPSKGFYQALSDLQTERGYVVHGGDDRYPIAENIEAIGLYELCEMLQE